MKKVLNWVNRWFCLILLVISLALLTYVCYMKLSAQETKPEVETSIKEVDSELFDEVYNYLFEICIDHPRIVMAQCIEESGNFSSKLFKEGNNCLGMKVPSRRPTLAKGVMYGHAFFKSWKDCINDYAIWQSIYARGLTEEDYLQYLDRVYASKKGYSQRLINIIKTKGL